MNELQLLNTLKWVVNNKDAEIAQELGDAMKKIFPNTGFANKINTALTAKARPTTQVSANKNYKVLDLTGIEKKKVEDVAVVKELPQQNLVGDTFDTFKTMSDIDMQDHFGELKDLKAWAKAQGLDVKKNMILAKVAELIRNAGTNTSEEE